VILKGWEPRELESLALAFNEPANPIMYLGIDPGKANGVCGYDAKYYLQFMYTIPSEAMIPFLHVFTEIKTCVVENFVLYPNKAREQTYSDMETSRVIGRVETWAELKKIELVKQLATVKITGYKWLGQKPPTKSNPLNHEMDANVHFMYWAIKKGLIPARSLVK
jgi:hypothetical protein